MLPKMSGKFPIKLNIDGRPIANKYREGKVKSTLKRELKPVLEIVKREGYEISNHFIGGSGFNLLELHFSYIE